MLGKLPRELDVNGTVRRIRADYGNVLTIISAFSSPDLRDRERHVPK